MRNVPTLVGLDLALREILNHWDPIGVVPLGAPRDEYDCMIPGLRCLVEHHADPDQFSEYLVRELREHHGIVPGPDISDVAQRLGALECDAVVVPEPASVVDPTVACLYEPDARSWSLRWLTEPVGAATLFQWPVQVDLGGCLQALTCAFNASRQDHHAPADEAGFGPFRHEIDRLLHADGAQGSVRVDGVSVPVEVWTLTTGATGCTWIAGGVQFALGISRGNLADVRLVTDTFARWSRASGEFPITLVAPDHMGGDGEQGTSGPI